MGIINHGILGGIQGSVGNVSGQKSKGRNVLTVKPDMSNVVKSSIQVVNNDKFNVLRKLYLSSNETINKITCANNSFKEAGYNFFSRKNYDNLTSDNIVSVDNVFIGNSGLPRVQILSAKCNSAKTKLTVTYNTATFNVYGSNSITYCCIFDATSLSLFCLKTNYDFFSGTFVVDLPVNFVFDFSNLYVSVIASSNTDSKKFSNTLNNWILSSVSVTSFKFLQSTYNLYNTMQYIKLVEGVNCEGLSYLTSVSYDNGFQQIRKGFMGDWYLFTSRFNGSSDNTYNFSVTTNGITTSCNVFQQKSYNYEQTTSYFRYPVQLAYKSGIRGSNVKFLFTVVQSNTLITGFRSEVPFITYYLSGSNYMLVLQPNNSGLDRSGTVWIKVKGLDYEIPVFILQTSV